MSNASQRNFGAAQRERARRVASSLEGEMPIGSLAITGDPGWDAFFGSLHDKADQAAAAGMGFRADLGGIGRWAEPSQGGGRLTANDRANIGGNIALGNLTDRNAGQQLALKDYADRNLRSAIDDMRASDDERKIAAAFTPPERAHIATESVGPDGRPLAYGLKMATPETERERILAQLPPHIRPQQQAAWAAQDAEAAKAEAASAKADDGPLVPVMGPNGQSILVPRRAAVGMRPASSREQGRPVTAGDAEDIADINTSLDQLGDLRTEIKDPGTIARIQSWLPTFVSEMTGGWTDEAKKQNAVISSVRQVIGKAMEGGVLRKEDEIKYRDILPVLGDSEAVVKSKIDGLEKRLRKKLDTRVNALSDAGFDVEKFRERGGAGAPPPAGGNAKDPLGIR